MQVTTMTTEGNKKGLNAELGEGFVQLRQGTVARYADSENQDVEPMANTNE
jgi:hypothetical protein